MGGASSRHCPLRTRCADRTARADGDRPLPGAKKPRRPSGALLQPHRESKRGFGAYFTANVMLAVDVRLSIVATEVSLYVPIELGPVPDAQEDFA